MRITKSGEKDGTKKRISTATYANRTKARKYRGSEEIALREKESGAHGPTQYRASDANMRRYWRFWWGQQKPANSF
jgi:hypothetical protein